MAQQLMELTQDPITFALYRYGYVYVLQKQTLSVVGPDKVRKQHQLEFTPTTWASYGGQLCMYDRYEGICQVVGTEIGIVALPKESTDRFSAPYANPLRNGKGILGSNELTLDFDINGLMLDTHSKQLTIPVQDIPLKRMPINALIEPGDWLLFNDTPEHFSLYNRTSGKLLHGQVPKVLVPYAYPSQGLLAAGHEGGYVFTPDMGISWRHRKLDGWGILTERTILQASPEKDLQIVQGWW